MYTADRAEIRRFFLAVWGKFQARAPLEPLESLVAGVIAEHPEFLAALAADGEELVGRDFRADLGEGNPFLHLGLHIALREQVGTDRPAGIQALHARLAAHHGSAHAAEHGMMECLGQVLWEARQGTTPPDEGRYLECLRRLI
jgi:hypothetical protein